MKRYTYEIDAAFSRAEGNLAYPERNFQPWPGSGATLARAVEFAVCGLLIAWGDPRKATKTQPWFDRVRPHLPAEHAAAVDEVWAAEGRISPPADGFAGLHTRAAVAVGALRELADAPTPANWIAPAMPVAIDWEQLDADARRLLSTAAAQARAFVPDVRMLLHGSRACGKGSPASDYDVLLIFPDPEHPGRPRAVGDVTMYIRRHGSKAEEGQPSDDVDFRGLAAFEQPEPGDELFCDLVRACSIEVPPAPELTGA